MTDLAFKEKRNINGVGFYASIETIVGISDDQKFLKIEFDRNRVDEEWLSAVEFGIKYFHEHFSRRYAKGLSVYVRNLHTMVVDSSFATVFFVTVKCLCQIIDDSLDLVRLDDKSATILLVK